MKKIKRNEPCPCGSGKKYKKCCLQQQTYDKGFSFMDDEGMHFVGEGPGASSEQLKEMTKEYRKRIKNSPMWEEMVQKFGKEKAEKLLKECKAESKEMI